MKILLNVSRELLDRTDEGWIECAAVKLEEHADGSFNLLVATDPEALSLARAADNILQDSLMDGIR